MFNNIHDNNDLYFVMFIFCIISFYYYLIFNLSSFILCLSSYFIFKTRDLLYDWFLFYIILIKIKYYYYYCMSYGCRDMFYGCSSMTSYSSLVLFYGSCHTGVGWRRTGVCSCSLTGLDWMLTGVCLTGVQFRRTGAHQWSLTVVWCCFTGAVIRV